MDVSVFQLDSRNILLEFIATPVLPSKHGNCYCYLVWICLCFTGRVEMKHTVIVTFTDREGGTNNTIREFSSFEMAMQYLEMSQELTDDCLIVYKRSS